MAVRLNLFSNTEQDTKKVCTVEELPQYMLKCIYDNNVAEESEEANRIVSTAVSGISDDDPDKEYIVAAVNRVSDEFHKSGAYSRLPGTQESAEKRKQKKKNGISFKREDEKEELMNWSPLQEVVEKLPTFTAGA